MIRCPHCGRSCILPDNTLRNMEAFSRSVHTVTECCGKIVIAVPRFHYEVMAPNPERKEDDWGRKSK
jgi:hypothetical protein